MPTPNFNLPIYGPDDPAELDTLLNGQSSAMDAALLAVEGRTIGLSLNRPAAGSARARRGVIYKNSDSGTNGLEFIYDGSAWQPYYPVVNRAMVQSGGSGIANQTFSSGDWSQVSNITLNFNMFSTSPVRVYFSATTYSANINSVLGYQLREDTTVLHEGTLTPNSSSTTAGTSSRQNVFFEIPGVAQGAHTYTLWMNRAAGDGNITLVKNDAKWPVQLSVDSIGG